MRNYTKHNNTLAVTSIILPLRDDISVDIIASSVVLLVLV
jgi:hypothetical protein